MKKRCYTKNFAGYAACGGRGITVCDQWRHDLSAFVADVSQLEHYDCPGHDLYRIDLDGHYEPGNVRFVSAKERARNRQGNRRLTFAGKTMCLMDWSDELGINYPALVSRLRHGWSVERAFTTPIPSRSDHTIVKKTIKVLPFYYYPFPGSMPQLAEIDQDGYVYMSHADQVIHRAKYSGVFVPLKEFYEEPESNGESKKDEV
jgi:hypothetical protein